MRVDIFHIGPQKCGTTWVYRCLKEHPQIACPDTDAVHFFDMHFAKGEAWLDAHYPDARPDQKRFEPTPSYIRSPFAAERIHAHNPDARIICCLRHPLERAFSHYWHEKKKGKIRHTFAEGLDNYDLFESWVATGFYARHLERYLGHFRREQILVQWFHDLESDPESFFRNLCGFAGIDPDFRPSLLHRRVNPAVSARYFRTARLRKTMATMTAAPLLRRARSPLARLGRALIGRNVPEETLAGVDAGVISQLRSILEPEIARLEKLLDVDLTAWRQAA
jgi:hypothetical protein